jgi:hypothetical protein
MLIVVFISIYTGFMVSYTDPSRACTRQNNLNNICNFQRWFDLKILTYNHMFKPTDPEGLFSTLSALFTAFGGYYFCLVMKDCKGNKKLLLK